jgi:molybdate transport system substrate-binding protein
LAAASTKDAIEAVAARFEKDTGTKVVVNTGASNNLAQQIIEGVPAQIFVSASQQWADEVEKKGLAERSVPLLTNSIVLIVPKGNPAAIKTPADLTAKKSLKVALAGEKVPCGIYADQALKALGLYDKLVGDKQIVRGQDVRVALTYVERGEAEAGIVYATDARVTDKVEVVHEFDQKNYEQVVYPAVLLKSAAADSAAKRLFEFLSSVEAEKIFREFGFTPLKATPPPSTSKTK